MFSTYSVLVRVSYERGRARAHTQVKVAQLNGIQLILQALTEHPQHTLCIQYCCWALKNLCLLAENKVPCVSARVHAMAAGGTGDRKSRGC